MGDTYNVGCEEECTNLEIAQKLVKAVMPSADPKEHIIFVNDRPFNDVRRASGAVWVPACCVARECCASVLQHVCRVRVCARCQLAVTSPCCTRGTRLHEKARDCTCLPRSPPLDVSSRAQVRYYISSKKLMSLGWKPEVRHAMPRM